MRRDHRGWNHNTHHHRALVRLLPAHADAALDIGCGDGAFAALLGRRCADVLALDIDQHQVAAARERCAGQPNVRVESGDFLTVALPSDHFHVVTALASFHHMPFPAAAQQAARVLRPGGRLVVLGVWTDRDTASDGAWNLTSSVLNTVLRRLRGPDVMTAPAKMPTTGLRQVAEDAARHLPGARVRRRLLWRYTLTWTKPAPDRS